MAQKWVKITSLRGPAGPAGTTEANKRFASVEARNTTQDGRLALVEAAAGFTAPALAVEDAVIAGVMANASSATAAAQRAQMAEALIVPRVERQKRPLIGGHIVGVGAGVNVDANYLDPTRYLENEMKAKFDIVSYYGTTSNPDRPAAYAATVLHILNTDPDRNVLWVMETWWRNQKFIDEMQRDSNGNFLNLDGVGPKLKAIFAAIVAGGNMDRLFLAPFHEGNGSGSYPWQAYHDDVADMPADADYAYWTNSPERYKQAYRLFVDYARECGVTCKFIQWFLRGSSGAVPDTMAIEDCFVGDGYADLIGLSYYNRTGEPGGGPSWEAVGRGLRSFMRRAERMSSRPVWLCEAGCALSAGGFDKGTWYSDLVRLVASNEMPRIEGMVMFMRDSEGKTRSLENAEQKRIVGEAVNAAKRPTRWADPAHQSRNLLPPSLSVPRSTQGWTTLGTETTLSITTRETVGMDAGATWLRITQPDTSVRSVQSRTDTDYGVYRNVSSSRLPYVIGQPHILTFRARADKDGRLLTAGIRQGIDTGSAGHENIQIGTVEQTYHVPFSTAASDTGSWRFPHFLTGLNTEPCWIEVTDIQIRPGLAASPNIEKILTKRVQYPTADAFIDFSGDFADCIDLVLTQNGTLNPPLGVPSDFQEIQIRVKQGGVGGWTLGLAGGYRSSSVTPSINTAANSTTLLRIQYDAAAAKWGLVASVQLGA